MKITKIQPAVKTAGRYNIFVDGAYSFSLDENQLLEEGLSLDLEISKKRLEVLHGESDFGKKYIRTLELILRRPRSKKEIEDYTGRKQWDGEVSNRIVKKLEEKNYINDEKFAKFWVSSRVQSSKPISRRKLQVELRQKGIKQDIVEVSLRGYKKDDEYEALLNLVEKKSKKYKDRQKFLLYLTSKGYSFEDSKTALKEKTNLL